MRVAAADAPGQDGALQVSEDASGPGVVEAVNDPGRFKGGAENLSGRLEPISSGVEHVRRAVIGQPSAGD